VAKKQNDSKVGRIVSAQPRLHQRAREIQSYGTVKHALPLDLETKENQRDFRELS
jgi:hypothetical protein